MKRKLIFVCSPYSGDVKENTWVAAEVCKAIQRKTSYLPVAPHLYFPQFLNDNVQSERKAGIEYGLELMDKCVAVIAVNKDGEMSAGMKKEVKYARNNGKPVLSFDSYRELLTVASSESTQNLEYYIKEMLRLQAVVNREQHPCSGCPHNYAHLLVCSCMCDDSHKLNDTQITIQLINNGALPPIGNVSDEMKENKFFKRGI